MRMCTITHAFFLPSVLLEDKKRPGNEGIENAAWNHNKIFLEPPAYVARSRVTVKVGPPHGKNYCCFSSVCIFFLLVSDSMNVLATR